MGRLTRSSIQTSEVTFRLTHMISAMAAFLALEIVVLLLFRGVGAEKQMAEQRGILYTPAGTLYPDANFAKIGLNVPITQLVSTADNIFNIVEQRHAFHERDKSWRSIMEQTAYAALKSKVRRCKALQQNLMSQISSAEEVERVERQKREININFDPVNLISSFFQGISNVIYGASISEVKAELASVDYKIEAMQATQHMLEQSQIELAEALSTYINESAQIQMTFRFDVVFSLVLDDLFLALSEAAAATGSLSKGRLPATVLPPAEAERAMKAVEIAALKQNREVAFTNGKYLHDVRTAVYVGQGNWVIFLFVPLISPSQAMSAYWFDSTPTIINDTAVTINVPKSLVAHSNHLYSDVKAVEIPYDQVSTACWTFSDTHICAGQILSKKPTCAVSILYHCTAACHLSTIDDGFSQITIDGRLAVYSEGRKDMVITCQKEVKNVIIEGLQIFNLKPGCQAETDAFVYHAQANDVHIPATFGAMEFPMNLTIPSSAAGDAAGLNVDQSFLKKAKSMVENIISNQSKANESTRPYLTPAIGIWTAPSIVAAALAGTAILLSVSLGAICLCAARKQLPVPA